MKSSRVQEVIRSDGKRLFDEFANKTVVRIIRRLRERGLLTEGCHSMLSRAENGTIMVSSLWLFRAVQEELELFL